nr:hypothetical protein [uncultured Mediterranean phage uvMED]
MSRARDKASAVVANFASTGIDDNADATAITIDSSETVLVGKTATNYQSVGVEAKANGSLWGTADGNNPLILVRKSSDGAVAQFYKDSTNVGSIGTASGDLTIYGDVGIRFSGDDVRPLNSSGAQADNSVDLGHHDVRWQDLYLGGNLYLGGTGSANAISDVEEGTFTPNFTGSNGGEASYNTREGSYTKIGRLVVAHIRIEINGKGSMSGSVQINNLPFTVANLLSTTSVEASGSVSFYAGMSTSVSYMSTFPMASTTNSQFHMQNGTSGTVMSSINVGDIDTDFNFRATVTYFTT